ncbi:FHA domain-containing protein [Streptomyces sp. STR69]|uniref:FHA domain-containing protein n=1 Tax=Streptomyces sp. STR69 TaxID=1796942 RepID=UPI0021CA2D8D|nr:FHA domain-containing protein [Streptomyces sp. STR69]
MSAAPAPSAPSAPSAAELCPDCGSPRADLARFCEGCRYDFVTRAGTLTSGTTWTATVHVDHDYFTRVMARSEPEDQGLYVPTYSPDLHIPLTRNVITIGRRRRSTGEAPFIDLDSGSEDPGVSHEHALLVRQPDFTWSLIDKGSTNGTTMNGAEDSVPPYVPVPLKDGDRVHVGLWTTITVHRD